MLSIKLGFACRSTLCIHDVTSGNLGVSIHYWAFSWIAVKVLDCTGIVLTLMMMIMMMVMMMTGESSSADYSHVHRRTSVAVVAGVYDGK